MKARDHLFTLLVCSLVASLMGGCATSPVALPTEIPESPLVEIAVLTTTKNTVDIPPKSRIVVSDIAGPCSVELKNALARRLVDNADYEVLSRDNLDQILTESKSQWAGAFNTETAVNLGRLLGASLFIVGEVVYCGPPGGNSFSYQRGASFDIFAVLQMIDPETGRVILSSANEGKYLPDSDPLLYTKSADDYEQPSTGDDGDDDSTSEPKNGIQRLMAKSRRVVEKAGRSKVGSKLLAANRAAALKRSRGSLLLTSAQSEAPATQDGSEAKSGNITGNYPAFKASEDLADRFADKFFSRPTWERVEMFKNAYWDYGDSVWYVKLGQCQMALSHLEERASLQVASMPPPDVAEYLHNYGVVLMCANQPERAMEKLRSAYRLGNNQASLRMLGLAAKTVEWALNVETDREPEIGLVAKRGG